MTFVEYIRTKGTAVGLLAALIALHLLMSVVWITPGILSIDEVAYHFAVRAVAEGSSPEIYNGYLEFPSPELEVSLGETIVERGGRLISKYPYLGSLLAGPLYGWLGFKSLIVVNSLAFAFVLAFTFSIARRFTDAWGSLLASTILAGATYAWQYSQAAWPHMLALACTLAAVTCACVSLEQSQTRRSCLWALASGCLFGVGVGARLDVVLLFGATTAVFFFHRPLRWLPLCCVVGGSVPGLLALSYENWLKQEVFWPLAYTSSHSFKQFVPAALGLFLLVAWRLYAQRVSERSRRRALNWMLGLGLALLLVALVLPVSRAAIISALGGVYVLAVDLRELSLDRLEPAMTRSDTGGVLYFRTYKKALLQSCCYLPVALVAVSLLVKNRRPRVSVLLLLLPPAVCLFGFGMRAWHGGLCANLRYFLPVLPFVAILTAVALRHLSAGLLKWWWLLAGGFSLLLGAGYVQAMLPQPKENVLAEFWVLTLPLLLAAVTTLFSLPFLSTRQPLRAAARGPLVVIVMAALTLSSLIAFTYDYRATRAQRQVHATLSRALLSKVEPNSLVYTPYIDPVAGLIDADRVRLASPPQDGFQSFPQLTQYHLAKEHPVYVFAPPSMSRFVELIGRVYRLEVVEVNELYGLFRVTEPRPSKAAR